MFVCLLICIGFMAYQHLLVIKGQIHFYTYKLLFKPIYFILCLQNLIDKMKRSFFEAAVVSILLYGCTTWTLTKRPEKIDGNYTRMLRAILNKSCRQHPTKHQLYGYLPPIMKTI